MLICYQVLGYKPWIHWIEIDGFCNKFLQVPYLSSTHRNLPGQSPTMYPLHWAASVTLDIDHDPSGPSGSGPLSWGSLNSGEKQKKIGNGSSVPSKLCISTWLKKTSWLLDLALNSWPKHAGLSSKAQWAHGTVAIHCGRHHTAPVEAWDPSVRVPSPYSCSLNFLGSEP